MLGGKNKQRVRRGDFSREPPDAGRPVTFKILVVHRKVIDLDPHILEIRVPSWVIATASLRLIDLRRLLPTITAILYMVVLLPLPILRFVAGSYTRCTGHPFGAD